MSAANKWDEPFEVGSCYFMLSYYDEAMQFPLIESFIFVGRNLDDGEDDFDEATRWFFQDPDSYFESGAFPNIDVNANPRIIVISPDTIELVLDKERLCRALLEVVDR